MSVLIRTCGLTPPPLNQLLGCMPTAALVVRRAAHSEPVLSQPREAWEAIITNTEDGQEILRATGASAQDAVDMLELLAIELLR